eukprot:TRINITY_DN38066_c0_g1_i1.p1 TRINITY_DN38066_c0_g1~~TRINITY_DN38066_c0_g1_i1.p1  ORF type:complete len:211 (-),score=41.96 TRINITY_DN38066_c0_g1_i1:62-694(-)
MDWVWVITFLSSAVLATVISLWLLLLLIPTWQESLPGKVRTSFVLGSGGHTAEMLKLVQTLDRQVYTPRTYFIAQTDKFSLKKLAESEIDKDQYSVCLIPRSREVAQSYLTSILTTLMSFLHCLPLVLSSQPQLLLVNGPGTCVPIAVLARLLSAARISRCKIVFVESLCRVQTLSLTGKILQFVADEVLVQWPELALKYPRTKYIGKFS